MDITLIKLEAIRQQYLARQDNVSSTLVGAMIELYTAGRIDVRFDSVTGEPVAELIEYSHPLVTHPMFAMGGYSLGGEATPQQGEPRKIGFTVN